MEATHGCPVPDAIDLLPIRLIIFVQERRFICTPALAPCPLEIGEIRPTQSTFNTSERPAQLPL